MRIVVMDTGRGIDADKVKLWRSNLGLEDVDELALVAWQAPKEQLPVSSHLVCGPLLRLGLEAKDWPVQPVRPVNPPAVVAEDQDPTSPGPLAEHPGAAPEWDADEAIQGTRGGLGSAELDEQLTEHAAPPDQAAAADREPTSEAPSDSEGQTCGEHTAPSPALELSAIAPPSSSLAHLPVLDPRRMRQAVRWRSKRLQRRASRFSSRQVRRVKKVGTGVRQLPSEVVSSMLKARSGGVAEEFAVAAITSRKVAELVSGADVVVPVDQRSQKAAWLLARRHPEPDVIVTLPAAARAVAARRHGV